MTHKIGIEVSSASVRMAAMSVGKGRPRLLHFAEVKLPYGAVVDGVVVDRDAVRGAITSCIAEGKFKASLTTGVLRARVSVAGLRAIIREIEMPPVPDAELDAAVRLQALDVVPFPVDRTLISARAIGPVEGSGAGGSAARVRVLIAAAHRDLVEPVVDVVIEAGIVVEGVDLAASPLVRAFANLEGEEAGPEAVVAVGAELTTVVVHERGEPSFVRTIAGGGNTVTRAIAAALDLPFPDAESLKRRLGDPASASNLVPPEAIAAARDGSTALLADIRSSVEYFSSRDGRSEVRRVVLTGGGAQLSGFLERLQQQMRAAVVAGDWLERIDTDRIEVDRDLLRATGAVVVGLTLPEPAGRKVLDLVPPETVVARRQRRVERWVVAAAVVTVLGLVVGGAIRYVQVHQAEIGVGSLDGEIAVLQGQIPHFDTVARQNAAISADQTLGQPLVSHEVDWPGVLAALVKYTPPKVGATGFSGTVSVPAAAATTTAATSAAAQASPSLPSPTSTLGTVSLSLSAPGFPSFKQWFDAMLGSGRFVIDQYSGVTNGASVPGGAATSSGAGISFSAQLGITGATYTQRLGEFEVSAP
ncbi:MAG: type pilus assembly protein PilM [Acidimicrobiaceae bacterium]|nr:type pilus assembly protein PilM [Acidimicrobiaceae bacterium]